MLVYCSNKSYELLFINHSMKDYFQNELHQTINDIFLAIKITSTIVGQ